MKKIDISKIIRADIAKMDPYIPGVTIIDLAKKYDQKPSEVIKLNANENSFGPSPLIKKAIENTIMNYYPNSVNQELIQSIAEYCEIPSKNIIVGSGSDELIDLLLRVILNEGDKVINCPPTFGMYSSFTILNRGKIIDIDRNEDFNLRVNEIVKACSDERVKIIFLCNPNNPSGNISKPEEIISILDTGKLVIVDEAYFEFSKITVIPLFEKYENLIILRTFSKWAGLAGLRIGYGIMSPKLINELLKIKSPFSVNVAGIAAAIATLYDLSFAEKSINTIIIEREKLYDKLKNISQLSVYPSSANYIYIQTNSNDFESLQKLFESNKIALRYFKSNKTGFGIRITIGTPFQNKKVIKVLEKLKKNSKYAFLDRDGALIFEPQDTFQIDSIEKLKILDGVIDGLKELISKGYELIMISNQDGLGTDFFPQADFDAPHERMLKIFEENGIRFKDVFICPHLPSENCSCRKPKIGLIKDFLKINKMDKDNSLVCGDRESDKQFAKNLGIKFVSMQTNGDFYEALKKGGVIR